ncbi:MAG: hypothetical protein JNK55_07145 [Rubrivivax sp.]|nr:hypothetical protein [Rubrivivax sp.]
MLQVFEASVALPRLRLLPQTKRLAADVDLTLQDRLLGGRWQGRLDFDAALRWEATDQMLRLTQVHVRGFSLVAGAAPRTATELQRRGVAPGAITAQERAVEIRFVPSVR